MRSVRRKVRRSGMRALSWLLILVVAALFSPLIPSATSVAGTGPSILISNYSPTDGYNGVASGMTTRPVVISNVAILPIENLSDNPVADDMIMEYLKREFRERALFHVVDDAAVRRFLARRRIRYTGAITKVAVREMGKVLGVDGVLVGSVNYYSAIGDRIVVGVNCRLVSAQDGSIVWADNLTYTGTDFKGILGLGAVKSLDVLASMVVRDLVDGMNEKFFAMENSMSPFEMERVITYPTMGKAGEKRRLRVKFLPLVEAPAQVTAVVGDEEIPLVGVGEGLYEGVITAPEAEGTYLVDLVAMDHSMVPYRFNAVTKVVVDNTPPKIDMAVSKEVFSSRKKGFVTFEPRLLSFEEIDEWRVDILDQDGNRIRSDRGYGKVPRKLIWRGETDESALVDDGKYTIALQVTDAAGNRTTASRVVMVKNKPPVINIDVDIVDDTVLFSFDYNPEEPIHRWMLSILDRSGNIIKTLEGEGRTLPERFEYPLGKDFDIRDLSFKVTAEDLAGNRFEMTKTIPSLFAKKIPFAELKGNNPLLEDF